MKWFQREEMSRIREENAQSEPVTNLCGASRLKRFRGSCKKK